MMNKKLTEDEVVLALKDWLEKKGWTILSYCLDGQRGIDIRAKKSSVELLVEAKGARGNMPHTIRSKFSKGQIKVHFGVAFLKILEEKAKRPKARVAIAQPYDEDIRKALKPVFPFIKKLGIILYWVREDKTIKEER